MYAGMLTYLIMIHLTQHWYLTKICQMGFSLSLCLFLSFILFIDRVIQIVTYHYNHILTLDKKSNAISKETIFYDNALSEKIVFFLFSKIYHSIIIFLYAKMYAYVRKISSTPTHFFHNIIKCNGRDVG